MKPSLWIRGCLLAATTLLVSGVTNAYGPHQDLDCLGCHDPHYAKEQKLFTVSNPTHPNPRTGTNIDGISALCLGCHNLSEDGGAGVKPIYLHMTHPVNVVPNERIAKVPDQLLRDGILQCVSCHDPHPSNPNWRYLRVGTDEGTKVGQFCAVCHGAKVDGSFYGQQVADAAFRIFSSMNESAGAGEFLLDDPNMVIANPTPDYIRPLGDLPNTIQPIYEIAVQQPWLWDSSLQQVPQELREARARAASDGRPLRTEPGSTAVQPVPADGVTDGFFNPFN